MPTQRQKAAFTKLLESPGSVSAAMRAAGYSPNTAKNPRDLVTKKGFIELMDKAGISDTFLAKRHKELLTVPIVKKTTKRGELIDTEESLNVYAISKGLDLAYKVKGHFAPERIEQNIKVTSVEEVKERIKNLKMKRKITTRKLWKHL